MCVTGIACFYQFVALYTVFIPWVFLLKLFSRKRQIKRGVMPEILFDGKCPLCIRTITVIHYLDWFERLAFTDMA
jgi:hypothetical protein